MISKSTNLSIKANLIYEILKELEKLTKIFPDSLLTTTTTTTLPVFPDSLYVGMEVWHTLSDQLGVQGSTVTNITDLSSQGRTGIASGSQRILNIESNGLKSLSSNGNNDKIQFPSVGMVARTIAILIKQDTDEDRWGDYFGILSRESIGGNEFSLACNALTPISGETGRSFLRPVGVYTSVQVDNILPSSYTGGSSGIATVGDLSLMQEYHFVVFELPSDVIIDTSTLAWLQERNVGGRFLKALFCDGWIWNRILTTEEKESLFNWLIYYRGYKNIYSAPNNIILDGNSLTIGATEVFNVSPMKLVLTSLGNDYTGGSVGYGSAITGDLLNRFNNVVKLKKRNFPGKNIYIPWEISNSLANGISENQCFSEYDQLCTLARNAGLTIIGATCIDRKGSLLISQGTFDTRRAIINNQILSYHDSFGEQVCDFAAIANLSDANNTTYFNSDKIHLTAAGNNLVATEISNQVLIV